MAWAGARTHLRIATIAPLGLIVSPLRSEPEVPKSLHAPRSNCPSWSSRWWLCTRILGPQERRRLLHCETTPAVQTSNVILASRHRVGLCAWPVKGGLLRKDPRVQSLDSLFAHAAAAGYDGVEISFVQFKGFYVFGRVADGEADASGRDEEFADRVRLTAERYGLSVLGATYHIMDGRQDVPGAPDFADADFIEKLSRRMRLDRKMGAGYVNFQIFLPPRYMQTPLAWREDEFYLRDTLRRAVVLRNLCWQHGLNAYFETHIDRWGEDPVFFEKVLGRAEADGGIEANGDLSHYLYRGWTKGPSIETVLRAVNHLHVRMARVHGDLSAETLEPDQDFATGGPTRQQWDFILRTGPLSSRTVCGEAGPLHFVQDTLGQDARMVPLLRAIACEKDGCVKCHAADFNPFSALALPEREREP